jgi:hypothetical protein
MAPGMAPGQQADRELLQRFEVQKFLGKGSYGSVYVLPIDPATCVRKIHRAPRRDDHHERDEVEMATHAGLSHANGAVVFGV